jgi:16S rRNA (cytosine967-C5)-methyltransferase
MRDPTRDCAFDLLSAVLDTGQTLEMAFADLPLMEARDRAAGHRLAATVLRRLGTLDAGLASCLRRTPPGPVRHVLRLGAAGLLLLGTSPHAAVATAVALARRQKLTPFTGLVNAVLRRVAQAGAGALEGLDGPRLDTPDWLWSAWGPDARAIAEAQETEPPLDLSLKPGAVPPPGGVMLPTGSVRFPPGTRVTDLPGFADGVFWVQDAAASLPAHLLAARPGERVADLCAAPGGKTAQLAAAGASVTALERDPARLARLRDNLARLRLPATLVLADAGSWTPPAPFDAVLLDAPCSATGIIRRHPDVKHLKTPRDVVAAAAEQSRLIDAAAAMLRPGGRLIYAVCSLQPEEGAAQLRAALDRTGLRQAPFTAAELHAVPEARTPDGNLRTHPGLWPARGGMDGFFVGRLVKSLNGQAEPSCGLYRGRERG